MQKIFNKGRNLILLVVLGLFFFGCSELLQILQTASVQKPAVKVQKVKLKGLNFDKADLDFVLAVDNPNAVAIHLNGFDYSLLINNNEFLKGDQKKETKIEARGSSTLDIPVSLTFKKLYRTYQSLKNADSLHYTLKTGLLFNLPVLGNVRIPVQTSGKLPTLKMPQLKIKSLKLENLGFTSAQLRLQIALKNPNAWSATLKNMDYRFVVNGSQWIQGQLNQMQKIAGKQESVLDIPINLNFLQMGRTVYNLLTNQAALNYELKGKADLQSSIKLLGNFELPIDKKGKIELTK